MLDETGRTTFGSRIVAGALLALAAGGAGAASAQGGVIACRAGEYGHADPMAFPTVQRLRAINVPARTGSAARCEVTDAIAETLQARVRDGMRDPRGPFRVRRPGWDAGRWMCRLTEHQEGDVLYVLASCRSASSSVRRVTMRLTS